MELDLENLNDNHKNIPCAIIASGPTMSEFPFESFNGKIITVGDAIIRGKKYFKADYWVNANNVFPVPNIKFHQEIINSFNETIFLFAESEVYSKIWEKSEKLLKNNLNVDWIAFDERHFHGKKCKLNLNCCELLDPNKKKLTIQETLTKYKSSNEIFEGCSVSEYALSLAFLMGCNPIYIQGVDMPTFSKDYTYFPSNEADLIMKKSLDIAAKKYKEIYFKEKKVIKTYLKSIINKLKNFFYLNKYSIFHKDMKRILNNNKILSNIAY